MSAAFGPLADALRAEVPWLKPCAAQAGRLLQLAVAQGVVAGLNLLLAERPVSLGRQPLRFVAQTELPHSEPYEAFIARTGCVPTRENLHDLFNGLMWLCSPSTKRRLNELQAQALAQHGVGGSRGPLRDALTLFDENGAVLQAPSALVQALRDRDWQRLFVGHRALWDDARLTVFGHALFEKLLAPRKAITAHVWVLPDEGDASDEAVAASLCAQRLAAKPFLPLPVMGIPGWCPENAEPAFYDDQAVFRPPARVCETSAMASR